jgi:hypothetical protein
LMSLPFWNPGRPTIIFGAFFLFLTEPVTFVVTL